MPLTDFGEPARKGLFSPESEKRMANSLALSEHSKGDLAAKWHRAEKTLKNMREQTKHAAKLGTHGIMTAAGGVAAGVLQVKMPMIPGTNIPSDIAIGSACVLAAMLDLADGFDEQLNAFGSGLLAVGAARETVNVLNKPAATT